MVKLPFLDAIRFFSCFVNHAFIIGELLPQSLSVLECHDVSYFTKEENCKSNIQYPF